jgi:hypothetical protein
MQKNEDEGTAEDPYVCSSKGEIPLWPVQEKVKDKGRLGETHVSS